MSVAISPKAGRLNWRLARPGTATLVAAAWCVWAVIALLGAAPRIVALDLGDTDNLMRLVQWRDFLAGQDWLDVSQRRFVGPENGDMHFSRIPDALMSMLYFLIQPFAGAETERVVLAIYPPLLLLAFLTALSAALRNMAGPRAIAAGVALTFLASPAITQFAPGRIDHHGLALALSMAALAATISAPRNRDACAIAPIFAILAAAVSLETAPVYAALAAMFIGRWIAGGSRGDLGRMGSAALFAAPAILVATLGLGGFADMRCDAFAAPGAAAVSMSGAIALALSRLSLSSWRARAVAAAIGSAMSASCFIILFPGILAGPYAGIDLVVRDIWLASVTEVGSPLHLMRSDPGLLLALYGFPFAALAAGAASLHRAMSTQRMPRLAALAFLAMCALILIVAIRGAVIAAAFAIPCAAFFLRDISRGVKLFPPQGVARFLALFLLVAPIAYGALGRELRSAGATRAAASSVDNEPGCDSVEAISGLRMNSPVLLFTPIDLGPAILAHTGHSVTAAPYHRNSRSIRRTIDVFTGDEALARRTLRASGADLLTFCPATSEARAYARLAPEGLAARLTRGETPGWLELVRAPSAQSPGLWRLAT